MKCQWLYETPGTATISDTLQSAWVWFTFPARAVFDVLMARQGFASYWETGCWHEFGALAGVFSAFAWLLLFPILFGILGWIGEMHDRRRP